MGGGAMIVYQMVNEITMDTYIGSTMWSAPRRFGSHKTDMRRGVHTKKVQSLCDKHGIDSFSFEILESYKENDKDFIRQREQYYINILKPTLNSSKSSIDTTGVKTSEETKKFLAEYNQKKNVCLYDRYTLKLVKTFKSRYDVRKELGLSIKKLSNIIHSDYGIYDKYVIRSEGQDPSDGFLKQKSGMRIQMGVYDTNNNLVRVYKCKKECRKLERLPRRWFYGLSSDGFTKNGLTYKPLK